MHRHEFSFSMCHVYTLEVWSKLEISAKERREKKRQKGKVEKSRKECYDSTEVSNLATSACDNNL